MDKQTAFTLFEQQRHEYLDHCRDIAERIFYQKGNVTIDDVRIECPVPSMFNPKVLGAVFNSQEWECVGYTKTKIKTSHGRLVGIWSIKKEYRKPQNKPVNYFQMAFV